MFRDAFNAAIPSEVTAGGQNIPHTDKEIPSFTIDIPQLDTGGFIEEGGMAQLHAGEQVVPAAEVDRQQQQQPAQQDVQVQVQLTDIDGEIETDEGHVVRIVDGRLEQEAKRAKRLGSRQS